MQITKNKLLVSCHITYTCAWILRGYLPDSPYDMTLHVVLPTFLSTMCSRNVTCKCSCLWSFYIILYPQISQPYVIIGNAIISNSFSCKSIGRPDFLDSVKLYIARLPCWPSCSWHGLKPPFVTVKVHNRYPLHSQLKLLFTLHPLRQEQTYSQFHAGCLNPQRSPSCLSAAANTRQWCLASTRTQALQAGVSPARGQSLHMVSHRSFGASVLANRGPTVLSVPGSQGLPDLWYTFRMSSWLFVLRPESRCSTASLCIAYVSHI